MPDTSTLYREARLRLREETIAPDHELPPDERRRRALEADRRFFRSIGQRSGEVRRRRAERLALLELLEKQRAEDAAGLASSADHRRRGRQAPARRWARAPACGRREATRGHRDQAPDRHQATHERGRPHGGPALRGTQSPQRRDAGGAGGAGQPAGADRRSGRGRAAGAGSRSVGGDGGGEPR